MRFKGVASKRAIACGVASIPSAALAAEPGTTLIARNNTIDAATSGSKSSAYKALAMNPLVDSVRVAHDLLDSYIDHFEELAYLR